MPALANARHEAFAQLVASGKTADEAYQLAGYAENSGNARRLKGYEAVAARIAELLSEAAERVGVNAQRVVAELAKIAFTDLADVADWGVGEVAFGFDGDGRQLPPEQISDAVMVRYVDAPYVKPINRKDLTPAARAAVAEVALTKEGFRIKMHDKVGALTQLARHLGMFNGEAAAGAAQLNMMFVDRPPAETREAWLERRKRELIDVVAPARPAD